MFGLWMVFAVVVATILGLAGWAIERGLRALHRPTRGAWALALVGSVSIPVALFWIAGRPDALSILPEFSFIELPPLDLSELPEAASDGLGLSITRVIAGAWLTTSAVLLAGLAVSWQRLHRALGACPTEHVAGVPILVSKDLGPAVTVGLRRHIVVPRWLLDERADTVEVVVTHERSHLEALDPELLLVGVIPALLMPWNPALWWQLARLRLAVEVDCDQRVLARTKLTKVEYGRVLVDVGSRGRERRFAVAAFSERPTDLHRRLERMMEKPTRKNGWMVLGMGFVAGVMTSAVFLLPRPEGIALPFLELLPDGLFERVQDNPGEIPQPSINREEIDLPTFVEPEAIELLPPPPSAVHRSASPVFTPMTVRPEIKNVSEVIRALEREYPPLLRGAGVGGRVVVLFYIDEQGRVQATRIAESSGHPALDAAALEVASIYEFTPARNRDQPRAVWVQFPIRFQVPEGRSEAQAESGEQPTVAERRTPTISRIEGEEVRRGDDAVSPFTTPPRLENAAEIVKVLQDEYPPLLRQAGVGGRVLVWVFVDTGGRVQQLRISESSGHDPLDRAAIRVASEYRFTPALNGEEPVAVWLEIPVTFAVR